MKKRFIIAAWLAMTMTAAAHAEDKWQKVLACDQQAEKFAKAHHDSTLDFDPRAKSEDYRTHYNVRYGRC
jgi:hypothetical protein